MGYKIEITKFLNKIPKHSIMEQYTLSNKLVKIGFSGLVALLGFPNKAESDANIKTSPQEQVWVADGHTIYRMNVIADNTGLNGEYTTGINVKPLVHSSLTLVDYGKPAAEVDFFEGKPMFFETFLPIGQTTGRVAADAGSSNKIGHVVWYDFTVNLNAILGQTNFTLSNLYTKFVDIVGDPQPRTLSNDTFTIVRPIYDVRKTDGLEQVVEGPDGKVDGLDAEAFEACSTGPGIGYNLGSLPAGCVANTRKINGADYLWADSDGDNDVDQGDFGAFQRCLGENKYAPSECLADE